MSTLTQPSKLGTDPFGDAEVSPGAGESIALDRDTKSLGTGQAGGAWVLKACVFATGLAGIVAEYVMSTLATYMIGDAVVQWALTISLMLFAMGVGARLSRLVQNHVLDAFAAVELVLSATCAASAAVVFVLSAWVDSMAPVIYLLSGFIGLLIGIEIPLATRLNQVFEELKVNISSVLEKDYYGALLGGLLFAFVALPYLGLSYTPIALGAVNLGVSLLLFVRFGASFRYRRALATGFVAVTGLLVGLAVFADAIVFFGEQRRYRDRIVHHEQSQYQRIVITEWKGDHWLYLNGSQQFSTVDEELYHEPLVHPAMLLASEPKDVLVLGGGDGLAVREILQHEGVESVTVVDLDPAMTRLAQEHPILVGENEGSLSDPRVRIVNRDALRWLSDAEGVWQVAIIDLPDPKSADLARLYSVELYRLVARHLSPGGVLVTQATSPYFTRDAFLSVLATVRAAGLVALPMHNHIPTLGEWGFVIGHKSSVRAADQTDSTLGEAPEEPPEELGADRSTEQVDSLREHLLALEYDRLETEFLNRDAMVSMLHFGKGFDREVEASDHSNLAVFYYYRDGNWDVY